MTRYDPSLIQEFADRLYAQARSIFFTYTLLGVLAGLVSGGAMGIAAHDGSGTLAVVGAVLLGVLAFALARDRAFMLRLQAQTALCQMQIEADTRAAGGVPLGDHEIAEAP